FRTKISMTEHLSSWRCPYCDQIATVVDENTSQNIHFFNKNNKDGYLGLLTAVIVCPNSLCKEYSLSADLYYAEGPRSEYDSSHITQPICQWRLKPQSSAKQWPEYIPLAIRQDYEEACLISSLSPKASA